MGTIIFKTRLVSSKPAKSNHNQNARVLLLAVYKKLAFRWHTDGLNNFYAVRYIII